VVKFSVHSIRKRTREDLWKEREVAHTDVRRRERNMHGRIFVPWIEGGKKRRKFFLTRMIPMLREVHSVSICEQWGLRAPLGAAELYREGSCCWRCFFPTSLMIRGHCPVFPDQQVWARSHAPCGGALQTVECNVAFNC